MASTFPKMIWNWCWTDSDGIRSAERDRARRALQAAITKLTVAKLNEIKQQHSHLTQEEATAAAAAAPAARIVTASVAVADDGDKERDEDTESEKVKKMEMEKLQWSRWKQRWRKWWKRVVFLCPRASQQPSSHQLSVGKNLIGPLMLVWNVGVLLDLSLDISMEEQADTRTCELEVPSLTPDGSAHRAQNHETCRQLPSWSSTGLFHGSHSPSTGRWGWIGQGTTRCSTSHFQTWV